MEHNSHSEHQTPTEEISELSRLGSMFLEPTGTMADIARRPTWLLPLVLGLVLVAIPLLIQPTRVDPEAAIKAQVEQAQRFGAGGADPEQLEQAIRGRSQGFWGRYGAVIMVFVAGTLGALALAGIFMLAYMMTGTSIGFVKSLSVSSWSGIPPTAVLVLLAVVFLYVKPQEDLNPLDPFANVLGNLSFLASQKTQPVMHGLLGSLDVFSFWRIFLLGIGFAAVSAGSLTVKKSTTVIVVLWILYLLVKAGFTAILS